MTARRPKTRILHVNVKVRASAALSPAAVRRELRTLINEQCFYSADTEDLRAVRVRAAGRARPA
jgi:hypothetical protein